MKRFIFLLLFVSALFSVSFSAEPKGTTVTLSDDGRPLLNPNMGWTMHFYSNVPKNYGANLSPSDALNWFDGCQVIYLRIPWCYLEPEEGVYQWSILDTPAQRWIAQGKQVAFRFTTSENWIEYATPKWVFDAGAKSVRYTFEKGPNPKGDRVDPVFDDPIFLEKLEKFLAAAGKRYNGRPEVAFVDIGTFGLWGEAHTLMSSKLSKKENARLAKLHMDLHQKYFPDTQLMLVDDAIGPEQPGDDFPLTNEAVKRGIGLRDDSILVLPKERAWFHTDLMQKFWRTVPTVIEHQHLGPSVASGAWDNDKLVQSVEEYHASYMSIHSTPEEEIRQCRDIIPKINQRLGYRLLVPKITYPPTVKINRFFNLSVTLANAGVAPCYQGGYFALTIKEKAGGIVAVLADSTFNVKDLAVGPKDKTPKKQLKLKFRPGYIEPTTPELHYTVPTTKPGTYDLFISIGKEDGTPVYALPYDNDDGQHRYKIGEIQLQE